MSMRETNILLTAVGRRAYLVEYFKEALRGTGGKVYAANCVRDTTGLLAADDFEIVPKSAEGDRREIGHLRQTHTGQQDADSQSIA